MQWPLFELIEPEVYTEGLGCYAAYIPRFKHIQTSRVVSWDEAIKMQDAAIKEARAAIKEVSYGWQTLIR